MPKIDPALLRFVAASGAALAADFALTMSLRLFAGLSLTLSAAVGFATVGAAFYFVHEYWTFRREGSAASAKRMIQNLTALGLAFSSRVATIGVLEWLHSPGAVLDVVFFGAGAGVSVSVNYLVNRYWVFKETHARRA